jgi:hypothetical protein
MWEKIGKEQRYTTGIDTGSFPLATKDQEVSNQV